MKKSIIIHEDTSALFETLGDEEAGQLLKAMLAYQNDRPVDLDGTLGAIFAMLKVGLDKDNAAYEKKCEKNRENIRKRWNTEEYESIPEDTVVYERIPNDTQEEEDIQEDLQVSEIPSKKARSKFIPPTVEEVAEYVRERGSGVDAQAFVDFYASKGWKVGSQPMKDWQASVRTWERKEPQGKAPPGKATRRNYAPFMERTDNDHGALQRELARKQRQAVRSG